MCCLYSPQHYSIKANLNLYKELNQIGIFFDFILIRNASPLTLRLSINDLLGGRGWWLVKGALVRGPFLYVRHLNLASLATPFLRTI